MAVCLPCRALYDNRIDTLRTEVFDDLPALEEL